MSITAYILFGAAALAADPASPEFFAQHVAPIIKERCTTCHDAAQHKGGLRLDTLEGWQEGGSSHAPLLTGEQSPVLQRITSSDPNERMPPKGAPLSAVQIDAIKAWLTAGAPWDQAAMDAPMRRGQSHWAFQRPVQSPLPQVSNLGWCRNPIDYFLLARMDAAGLAPSPEADQATLLRRLSLDITGLPPTPAELAAFLADAAPDSYERAVERLLASRHYGERMAIRWLDIARFADTNGYEKDRPRSVWPYRDWVINAFNNDMPFDQFTVEQLAGDLLPSPTQDQRIATGFLRNSLYNEEGGVDVEEFRFEAMVDRVATTATAFLGLTMACAQCHDHKFDPISHKDYFSFYAFLNNTENVTMPVKSAEIEAARAAKQAEIAAVIAGLETSLEEKLGAIPVADGTDTSLPSVISQGPEGLEARRCQSLGDCLSQWVEETKPRCRDWQPLDPIEYRSAKTATLSRLDDKSVLVSGECPNIDTYTVSFRVDSPIAALRLEALTHESLPGGGPGRGMIMSPDGDFFLSEVRVFAAPWEAPEARQPVTLGAPTASFAMEGRDVAKAVDRQPDTGWGINGRQGTDQSAVLPLASPVAPLPGGTLLTVEMEFFYVHQHTLGRFRISAAAGDGPHEATGLPADIEALLLTNPADERVKQHFLQSTPLLAEEHQKIEALKKELPQFPTALVLEERATPRPTHLHHRGEYLNPREEVPPATPEALHPFPEGWPRNRLAFARWLVAEENPLFARVTVNRLWQMLFGRGIVETTEDFGLMATPPTHPELLDWLAVEFQRRGFSTREILRLIVTSSAYRQSAMETPERLAADPRNDLLARAPRFRLDAELVRDVTLASSGLLSTKMGGPSVYPAMQKELLEAVYGGAGNQWPTSEGEDRYRRGVYTYIKRTLPYPSAITFDMPARDSVCTRRVESNTPLQALTLLNNSEFVVAAKAMAARVLKEAPVNDAARLRQVFLLALSREPDAVEEVRLLSFLQAQRARFDNGELDPTPLVQDFAIDGIAPQEQAAWATLCRVVLNLDETISRS